MESDKAREKRYLNNFNLTIEKWNKISAYQSERCWLCGRKEPTGKRLSTDHSHLDGLVRGHLCSQCNPFLGKIENGFIRLGLHKVEGLTLPALIEKIAAYLKNPPAATALGGPVYGYPGKTGTDKHRSFLKRQARETRVSKPLIPPRKRRK